MLGSMNEVRHIVYNTRYSMLPPIQVREHEIWCGYKQRMVWGHPLPLRPLLSYLD